MALWQPVDSLVPHIPLDGNSMSASGGVETAARFNNSSFAGTSGKLWVSYFTNTADTTITKLAMVVANTGATGITLARLALFTVAPDGSITKVAQTASDNAVGASAYNIYERVFSTVGGFPSSYALVSGTRYALGFLQAATTACDLSGEYVIDSGAAPIPSRVIAAQVDIGASYAVASLPVSGFVIHLRGRQ